MTQRARPPRTITAVDLFCGAGGTSTGLAQACDAAGVRLQLTAINHWDHAIETHSANHPAADHYCASLDALDPRQVVPSGRLDLLVASPECTHHSVARGGRPMNDQSRSSAFLVLRWLEALYVDHVLLENVPEFTSWGPLGANGRPLKSKRGALFTQFVGALEALGYRRAWRVLNCADYGDPTTRRRLFLIASRGNKRLEWPEPTHSRDGRRTLFGPTERWRPAREIIDWTIPGKSIFRRKRPLRPATLRRIEAGLRKFCGEQAEPFLVVLRNNQDAQSVETPVPTLTTSGANVGLAEPFVIGQQSGSVPRSTGEPVPTVATKGAIGLVQPFLIGTGGPSGSAKPRSVDKPLNTVIKENRYGLVEPFLLVNRNNNAPKPIDGPVPVLCTGNHIAVVQPVAAATPTSEPGAEAPGPDPFLVQVTHSGGAGQHRQKSIDEPIPTVTCAPRGELALVQPFIVPFFGERPTQEPRAHSLDDPAPTVTSHGAGGLVEPLLVKYNGTADAQPVDKPAPTITTRDRLALVQPSAGVDILFRMLQPHELAAAMGFPSDYKFTGGRSDQVKQIGNAVPVQTARALVSALLGLEPIAAPTNRQLATDNGQRT